MDDILEPVDRRNLALTAFVRAAGDEDFVIFANGDRADLWSLVNTRGCMAYESAITYVVLLS